jgi:hypothetical protein
MSERLPIPRLVPGDVEALERRAREYAAGGVEEETDASGKLRLVLFRLRGGPCAVDAAVVERAVPLGAPFAVPLADGSERAVAFVDERPVAVVDLAGHAAGAPRRAAALRGVPALVVATELGPVAVAVDGPLELAEDRLAGAAAPEEGALRLAGRLAGGAALLDAAWLASWAGKAVRP